MRLDPFIRDYRQFMDELVSVLASERTRFYLDTSLLMWLVRLGSAARAEFLAWCQELPEGSVRVPVWAGHELHRHLVRRTVAANVQTTVSETERKLDEFVRLASERADEQLCRVNGYPGRQGYMTEVEQAFAKLRGLAKVVANDQQMSTAADEVIAFANAHMLDSDITPIVKVLEETGDFRYSHLMPPGYHDKKEENRFGDVVIWEEMLADIQVEDGAERRNGVLISRDEKTDWVSSAPLVKAGEKPPQKSNRDLDLDVTRAHPLLVHEFMKRARGAGLYVVPPSFLASALDYDARRAGRPSAVPNWLAAAHRPDFLPRLAGMALPLSPPASTPPTVPAAAAPAESATAVYRRPSLVELMRLSVADDARAYLQATPLDHSALVGNWRDQLVAGTMAPERFGRLLADLGLRGRSEWLTQLPSAVEELRATLPPVALNGVVLGAAAPVYFDGYGEPLRRPRDDLGATILILERDPMFAPAFAALAGFIAEKDVELPYVPGTGRGKVRMGVDAADGAGGLRTLRDVRVGNESVLVDELPDESRRRLSIVLGRERPAGCTGQELRALLAREFLVPIDLLNTDYDNKRFTWLPDAGLVSLDTSSPGGVSATATDEEDGV